MFYVLVVLVAVAAGAAVGIATLRTGRTPRARPETWTQTYEAPEVEASPAPSEADPASQPPAGRSTSLPADPTAQTRITGVLGLIVACLVAAGAIVGALYAAYLVVKGAFGG